MAEETWTNMPPHVLELLDGMRFPLTKAEIIEYALQNDGGEEAMDILQAMPDLIYENMNDLNRSLGLIQDLPGTDDGYWPASEEATMPDEHTQKVTKFRGKGQL